MKAVAQHASKEFGRLYSEASKKFKLRDANEDKIKQTAMCGSVIAVDVETKGRRSWRILRERQKRVAGKSSPQAPTSSSPGCLVPRLRMQGSNSYPCITLRLQSEEDQKRRRLSTEQSSFPDRGIDDYSQFEPPLRPSLPPIPPTSESQLPEQPCQVSITSQAVSLLY